jgi:hypothetical protein
MSTLADLNSGGKRTRLHDAQMVVKLPASAKALVKEVAGKEDVSEATIVRWALAEYFERRGYRR